MTTAYEYLERDERRIRMPVVSATVAVVSCFFVFTALIYMYFSASRLEREYAAAVTRVKNDAQQFIDRATTMLPPESAISELEQNIQAHNLAIGGGFSIWTKLFNRLDALLPEGAIITAIENPFTQKPVFAAEDRFFKFRVALLNSDDANSFFLKLSETPAFENLSFNPKGEIRYQGRAGFSIEFEFRYNDAN